jgi:SAM-dependent methyltransferase
MAEAQPQIDSANANFWDELCGTTTAQALGIADASRASLSKFDDAYLEMYPYLPGYLPSAAAAGERVLEVGLGYGTASQILAERDLDYHGLDIAPGPVEMVRHRLRELGRDDPEGRVRLGSILDAPYPDASFDRVVAIGCLHHTGDLGRAVSEVHRILVSGGQALVMIYNKHSYRRFKLALGRIPGRLRGRGSDDKKMRASYDANAEGEAAPATEYTSVRGARELFGGFSEAVVRRENFDFVTIRGRPVDRNFLLGLPARRAGLDLYITATK